MEKRLNAKVETYVNAFKRDVADKVRAGLSETDLLSFVMDYRMLTLDEKDFLKRKRSNNVVPLFDKCIAKRMCGTQCTRRKQGETNFCGTHIKGTPHGVIEQNDSKPNMKQIEVFQMEFVGITHYIDTEGNVYSVEDILNGKQNPRVISNYKVIDGVYTIV
jgi:hypothetical protein